MERASNESKIPFMVAENTNTSGGYCIDYSSDCACCAGYLGGYLFHWDWTGFNANNKSGKTLWDWMQLLFIPVVLAVAGFWFNHRERKAAELRAENERKAVELRAEAERGIEQQRAKAEKYLNSCFMRTYVNPSQKVRYER